MLKILGILFFVSSLVIDAAQEERRAAVADCMAEGQEVYTMETHHIKPAMPLKTPKPGRKRSQGQFTLELVVNAEGAVCNARVVRVMSAADQDEAKEMAAFIPGHWTFKPGCLRGSRLRSSL